MCIFCETKKKEIFKLRIQNSYVCVCVCVCVVRLFAKSVLKWNWEGDIILPTESFDFLREKKNSYVHTGYISDTGIFLNGQKREKCNLT